MIDEAVQRARSEGVSDEHPLVRLDNKTAVNTPAASDSSTWRIAAVMVGLAASIALAVFLMRSEEERETGESNSQIAQVKPDPPAPELPEGNKLQPDPASAIVSSQSGNSGVIRTTEAPNFEKPIEDGVQSPQVDGNAVAAMPDSGTKPNELSPKAVGAEPAEPAVTLGSIVVINVELTDEGREQDVFNAAMMRIGLKASRQLPPACCQLQPRAVLPLHCHLDRLL